MHLNKMRKIQGSNEYKVKSLKDLDELDDEAELNLEEGPRGGTVASAPIDLNFYLLLNHRSNITNFKLMMPDLYEGFKNAIPTVITTMTVNNWVYLWYENLMDK